MMVSVDWDIPSVGWREDEDEETRNWASYRPARGCASRMDNLPKSGDNDLQKIESRKVYTV